MPDHPRVASLHRYPVKSLLGERAEVLDVEDRGIVGDRRWGVRTARGKIGSGKSSRRFAAVPGLQLVRATECDGVVLVTFPDGTSCPADTAEAAERLSAHAGRSLTLVRESTVSHFDDGPISLLGLASVDAVTEERGEPVDPARFRANILIDGLEAFAEEAWVGRSLSVGATELRIAAVLPRCVMVNARTADLPAQRGNLAAIARLNGGHLGIVATVIRGGPVRVGDPLIVH